MGNIFAVCFLVEEFLKELRNEGTVRPFIVHFFERGDKKRGHHLFYSLKVVPSKNKVYNTCLTKDTLTKSARNLILWIARYLGVRNDVSQKDASFSC